MGWESSAEWLQVLAKATISFLEEQQVMKAQGFLETLWYFSLTWPQILGGGKTFIPKKPGPPHTLQ